MDLGIEGLVYCRAMDSMYINELWLYNIGDYVNNLRIICGIYVVMLLNLCSLILGASLFEALLGPSHLRMVLGASHCLARAQH